MIFPGMDPYLEDPAVFPDLHDSLISYLREFLNARLPAPYYASSNMRVLIEPSHRRAILVGDNTPAWNVATGIVLLIAATPLILLAELLTQNFFGGGSSRQEIVDLFNTSRTLQQRVLIIVLAVVVAPISEEEDLS